MPIGIPELLVVLVIVLLILGPKRLPALGRSLGGGLRNFKDAIGRGGGDGAEDPDAEARERPALEPPPADRPAGEPDAVSGDAVRERRP